MIREQELAALGDVSAHGLRLVEQLSSLRLVVLEAISGEPLDAIAIARDLENRGLVSVAENELVDFQKNLFVPNDPRYLEQWHFDRSSTSNINIIDAWDTVRGAGVNVAIVDDVLLKLPRRPVTTRELI